jgi:tRNA G18 (ribose-2'-O)-methylase SpoU
MPGYFEIGIYQPNNDANIGALWRSAYQLGAAGIFTIGGRYHHQPSDVFRSAYHIPLRHYAAFEDFLTARPEGARLVGIEMGGQPLSQFVHPAQAIYLLGSESIGLPAKILSACNSVVSLEAINRASYNVATTGGIVMYHRQFLSGGAGHSKQD